MNLALLAFGTPRLISRFGPGFALITLPLAAAAGATVLAIHGVVTVMYALRIATTRLRSALYEPALNRVLVTITAGESGPTRLLRGLVPRFGEALGAALALLFSVVPALEVRALALLLVVVLAAWGAAASALRAVLPAPALPEAAIRYRQRSGAAVSLACRSGPTSAASSAKRS